MIFYSIVFYNFSMAAVQGVTLRLALLFYYLPSTLGTLSSIIVPYYVESGTPDYITVHVHSLYCCLTGDR
jgi:hypothetical protein